MCSSRKASRFTGSARLFDSFYIVNAGFLKIATVDDAGNERVLGFPMKGDMLGLDGIHTHRHPCETLALSECDLILLPFARMSSIGRSNPDIENLMLSDDEPRTGPSPARSSICSAS